MAGRQVLSGLWLTDTACPRRPCVIGNIGPLADWAQVARQQLGAIDQRVSELNHLKATTLGCDCLGSRAGPRNVLVGSGDLSRPGG